MVAASEPLAADVGVDILKKGGNAFDAAVAVGFALAVTFPEAGNIGGGGFMTGLTEHGTAMFLDFREVAPSAATSNMFLDEQGNIIPGKSTSSYKAIGVPGTVDGLVELQKKFGKLTLQQDMQPAINLAKFGFTVSPALHKSLADEADRLQNISTTASIFYPDGQPLAEGATLVQPDLANTLQRIADQGRIGFYEGETARLFAQNMERMGGLITANDLKKYHAKWREAFVFGKDDYLFITPSLPSSGGIVLAQILGMVDLPALKADGHNTAAYVHDLVEPERLAYADRNAYLGDSDFVKVPVGELTSRKYLEGRRKLIPAGRAGVSTQVVPGLQERMHTTHYSVVDKFGNVAAVTYTLNDSFGMGAVLPGLGFLLNNEMDDFTSKVGTPNLFGLVQGSANAIAPGKRMLSSMAPTIIKKNGRFWATIGSPGGSTIITTVLQTFLNMALFDMNVQQAVDAGRFHHQHLPDRVSVENGALTPEVISALVAMGYDIHPVGTIGRVNAIMRMPDGTLAGWSDTRGSGKAVGY